MLVHVQASLNMRANLQPFVEKPYESPNMF